MYFIWLWRWIAADWIGFDSFRWLVFCDLSHLIYCHFASRFFHSAHRERRNKEGQLLFFASFFFLHSNPYIPVCRVGGSVVSVFLERCPVYSESCRSRKPYRGGVLKHAAPIVYRNIQHSNREWMESTRIYRCTITGWLLVSFCAIIPRFL